MECCGALKTSTFCLITNGLAKSEVFPTQTISFERILCQAPKNLRKFTEDVYGDIYRVPMDITTHCEHVSKEQLRALENQEL